MITRASKYTVPDPLEMDLLERIAYHEGFSEYPYVDVLVQRNPKLAGFTQAVMDLILAGFASLLVTFGFGFTFLTREESLIVLGMRITTIREGLAERIVGFDKLHPDAQDVLVEMAYQLGVRGLLGFKKTIALVEAREYKKASKEMLDSAWAIAQTPKRAKTLSAIMARAS